MCSIPTQRASLRSVPSRMWTTVAAGSADRHLPDWWCRRSAEQVVVEQLGHPGRIAPCRPSVFDGEQVVQLGAEQRAVAFGGLVDAQPGSQGRTEVGPQVAGL